MGAMVDQEVLDLERDFWLIGGGNPAFWQEHCADDAILALPTGIMSKADTVGVMETSRGWETVQFDEVHEVRTGDTVIVSYRATGRAEGELDDYNAVVSSAYARRDGIWRLVFHQQSPIQ
jgi:hypothetical protein